MVVKITIILLMHLFADFLLQGSTFSKMKMSKISYLFLHVLVYTAFFIVISPLLLSLTFQQGLIFSGINGGIHLVVDFITSRLKRMFWQKNESAYIAIISADNLIHVGILIYTYITLFPEVFKAVID
jgi:membrane-bound metal-dependent hydrolase YbcI (DUF457 family)